MIGPMDPMSPMPKGTPLFLASIRATSRFIRLRARALRYRRRSADKPLKSLRGMTTMKFRSFGPFALIAVFAICFALSSATSAAASSKFDGVLVCPHGGQERLVS